MSVLQVVMAHAGGQEVFSRHEQIWERLGLALLIFCPEDSIVRTQHPMFRYGHASHSGEHAIQRFRNLLYYLASTPHDHFLIQEYDSFSLGIPELATGLFGNRFGERSHRWLGSQFFHPPLFMDRVTLEEIITHAGVIPDHAERGFWDRWLGLVCERGNIPAFDWSALGFSHNTIEPSLIKSAVEAKQRGAIHFHGVKSEECFQAIT